MTIKDNIICTPTRIRTNPRNRDGTLWDPPLVEGFVPMSLVGVRVEVLLQQEEDEKGWTHLIPILANTSSHWNDFP